MKDKLKQSFKPTPERYRYTVDSAVSEALTREQSEVPKRRLSKVWRVVIVAVLVAALVPTTVFGTGRLYGLIVNPVDDYGLELDVQRETEAPYPTYVKMHVEVPEGFAKVPNTDGLKYYSLSAEEPYTDGFSLDPMRFRTESDRKEYIGYVDSYEERVISGRVAYEVKLGGNGWDRLYIYYEDVNVFLLIFHKDVTDEQLADFVKGISFTEGSADDFTFLSSPYDERRTDDDPVYSYDEVFAAYPLDTVVTFKEHSVITDDETIRVTAQISDVRVADSISGLDPDSFNAMFGYAAEDITDESGYLLTQTAYVYKEGDGFTTTDELISSEEKEQKLILANITFENLSDEDLEPFYMPYYLDVMDKNADGTYTHAHIIDLEEGIFHSPYTDSEPVYLTPHGDGTDYYLNPLPAHSSVTYTVGFRCQADMVDKAYFSLNFPGNVIDPPKTDDNPNTSYLFKVQ